MNEFTKQILLEILQREEAWDKKTRELKYDWVVDVAFGRRESLFVTEQMRLIERAVHLCRLLTDLPEEAYQTILCDGEEVEYFADECLTERFTGVDDTRVSYIAGIWEGYYPWAPDMSYDATKEEIYALPIRPNLVPAKKGQPSLF